MSTTLVEVLTDFSDQRAQLRAAVEASDDWSTYVAAAKAGVISSQSLGFRAERFVAEAFGWTRVPASMQRGDLVTSEGEFVELKNTIAAGDQILVRQIRQAQRVNWLMVLVANGFGLTDVFILNRPAVEWETRDMTACHGTRSTATELAMAFPVGGDIHRRWLDRYLVASVHDLEEAAEVVNAHVNAAHNWQVAA